jgi:hypothetical protein
LLPVGIWLIALAHFLFSGDLQAATPTRLLFFPLIVLAVYTSEAGFRGFALPRLLTHIDPIPASLLLGFLGAALYAPFFWREPQILILIIALGSALSIISTWLYLGSGESVLLTTLFQASFITCGLVISPVSHGSLFLAAALTGLWALFLVMRCGGCLISIQTDDQASVTSQSVATHLTEQVEPLESNRSRLSGQFAIDRPGNHPIKNT